MNTNAEWIAKGNDFLRRLGWKVWVKAGVCRVLEIKERFTFETKGVGEGGRDRLGKVRSVCVQKRSKPMDTSRDGTERDSHGNQLGGAFWW